MVHMFHRVVVFAAVTFLFLVLSCGLRDSSYYDDRIRETWQQLDDSPSTAKRILKWSHYMLENSETAEDRDKARQHAITAKWYLWRHQRNEMLSLYEDCETTKGKSAAALKIGRILGCAGDMENSLAWLERFRQLDKEHSAEDMKWYYLGRAGVFSALPLLTKRRPEDDPNTEVLGYAYGEFLKCWSEVIAIDRSVLTTFTKSTMKDYIDGYERGGSPGPPASYWREKFNVE